MRHHNELGYRNAATYEARVRRKIGMGDGTYRFDGQDHHIFSGKQPSDILRGERIAAEGHNNRLAQLEATVNAAENEHVDDDEIKNDLDEMRNDVHTKVAPVLDRLDAERQQLGDAQMKTNETRNLQEAAAMQRRREEAEAFQESQRRRMREMQQDALPSKKKKATKGKGKTKTKNNPGSARRRKENKKILKSTLKSSLVGWDDPQVQAVRLQIALHDPACPKKPSETQVQRFSLKQLAHKGRSCISNAVVTLMDAVKTNPLLKGVVVSLGALILLTLIGQLNRKVLTPLTQMSKDVITISEASSDVNLGDISPAQAAEFLGSGASEERRRYVMMFWPMAALLRDNFVAVGTNVVSFTESVLTSRVAEDMKAGFFLVSTIIMNTGKFIAKIMPTASVFQGGLLRMAEVFALIAVMMRNYTMLLTQVKNSFYDVFESGSQLQSALPSVIKPKVDVSRSFQNILVDGLSAAANASPDDLERAAILESLTS